MSREVKIPPPPAACTPGTPGRSAKRGVVQGGRGYTRRTAGAAGAEAGVMINRRPRNRAPVEHLQQGVASHDARGLTAPGVRLARLAQNQHHSQVRPFKLYHETIIPGTGMECKGFWREKYGTSWIEVR